MRSPLFWLTMVVFQVAFVLTVFAVTRHYYLSSAPPARLPAWALGVGTALPSSAPSGTASALVPPLSFAPASPIAAPAVPAPPLLGLAFLGGLAHATYNVASASAGTPKLRK